MLEEIFISKTRVKILTLFFTHLTERFHVREITRQVDEEINAVRRELDRLYKAGFFKREKQGNKVCYSLRKESPLFPEILRMIAKETGLGKSLIKEAKNIGKVKYMMLSAHLLYGRVASQNEVDLLLVGSPSQAKVAGIVKEAEKFYGHEINYAIFSEEEFDFRKKRYDPFINSVLMQPLVMLFGDEVEFIA